MESHDLIEGFDPLSEKCDSVESFTLTTRRSRRAPRRSQINRPSRTRPARLADSPVRPPRDIERRHWRDWWRRNRYLYGDRDYYVDLGYPIWWIDSYYPLYDYGYDSNSYYDYPITYPPTIVYPATQNSPVVTTAYPANGYPPTYPATSTSALATDQQAIDQQAMDQQVAPTEDVPIGAPSAPAINTAMFTPAVSGLSVCCLIIILIIILLR